MSEIDWDKAPEWATKHGYAGLDRHQVWMDDCKYTYCDGRQDGMVFDFGRGLASRSIQNIDSITERPSPAWSGEAICPVGVSIEWFSPVYGWLGGKVIGHDGTVTVVAHNDGYTGCHPHEVRPIRTPEQIAADEREAAIKEMSETINTPFSFDWVFAKLYDAGWRKTK